MIDSFNVIIPSAGNSSRFESDIPKQFQQLNGKLLINHSIDKFLGFKECKNIVIPISGEKSYEEQILFEDRVTLVTGGSSRAESVKLGFDYLFSIDSRINILIHDAARPCFQVEDLIKFLKKFSSSNTVGSIFASPCTDTIKSSQSGKTIDATVERTHLWQAQTPQIFEYEALESIYKNFTGDLSLITDESSMFEDSEYLISIFQSSNLNLKVTVKEDMELAQSIIKNTIKS